MFHYLVDRSDGNFKILREISEEDYLKLKSYTSSLAKLQIDLRRIDYFNEAYFQFAEEYSKITEENFKNGGHIRLSVKLTSFLSSFKKYLDNWETSLKHDFGKSSEPAKRFKEETGKTYDENIEYSFMYHLRNFDQHCGIVFAKTIESLNDDGTIRRSCVVSKDYLLNSKFDGWKPQDIEYINNFEDDIDIFPIIERFYNQVLQLNEKIVSIRVDKQLVHVCSEIIYYLKNDVNEDYIVIMSFAEKLTEDMFNSNVEVNITSLYVFEAKFIVSQVMRNNSLNIIIGCTNAEYTSKYRFLMDISWTELEEMIKSNNKVCLINNRPFYIADSIVKFGNIGIVVLVNKNFVFNEVKGISEEFLFYAKALLKV